MNAVTETVAAEPVSGVEIFVPLAKLKKSPRNARKVPHGEAAIEALAASIQHKGLIQNLVVEPETKDDGTPTGNYFVTAGEGRRQAMLLRAKRKQIKKSELVRCWLDTANDPSEISLDENVTRTPMHPADQFERFQELSENKGWGAEEIGARFGVTAGVVKQRLRLGAVSPKLLQVYREDGLTLDQLMAFAITEDHQRQEQVFANLHHNHEPWIIRRDLTAANVPADDRRAVFVGADAYVEAGGNIIRDLFSEDRGGFFEDAGLLDMLAVEKLRDVAGEVQAEGWKWTEAHIDYPHAHGMRRFYPQSVSLSEEDEARLEALSAEYDELAEGYSSYDEMPEDTAAKLEAVSDEIDTISAKRSAYDANVIAHGGAFVVLHHDGSVRVERGFGGAQPSIEDAMAVALAALCLLGLGIFGPSIANGIVSGGPALGAGAAAGTALAAGGALVGGAAAARLGAGAVAGAVGGAARGAAFTSGAANSAYALGSAGKTGAAAAAGGAAGVGRAAVGAALSPLRKAAASLKDNYRSGGRAAVTATGGTISGGSASRAPDATGGSPAWAAAMKRRQTMTHGATVAAHTLRSGDGGGSGSSVDLSQKD